MQFGLLFKDKEAQINSESNNNINVWHAEKKTEVVAFLFNFFGFQLLVYVPFQHISHT